MALLQQVDDVRVMASPTELDADVRLDGVRAVLTPGNLDGIDTDITARLRRTSRLSAASAPATDNMDTAAAASANVPVVHAPAQHRRCVRARRHVRLALARRAPVLDRAVKRDEWSVREGRRGDRALWEQLAMRVSAEWDDESPPSARRSTCGLVRVHWSRSSHDPSLLRYDLDELISTADVIQSVALTPHTRHLISVPQFRP